MSKSTASPTGCLGYVVLYTTSLRAVLSAAPMMTLQLMPSLLCSAHDPLFDLHRFASRTLVQSRQSQSSGLDWTGQAFPTAYINLLSQTMNSIELGFNTQVCKRENVHRDRGIPAQPHRCPSHALPPSQTQSSTLEADSEVCNESFLPRTSPV